MGKHPKVRGNTCSYPGCERESYLGYRRCFDCRERKKRDRLRQLKQQKKDPSPLFGLKGWSKGKK